jgi:hypothetical protein
MAFTAIDILMEFVEAAQLGKIRRHGEYGFARQLASPIPDNRRKETTDKPVKARPVSLPPEMIEAIASHRFICEACGAQCEQRLGNPRPFHMNPSSNPMAANCPRRVKRSA